MASDSCCWRRTCLRSGGLASVGSAVPPPGSSLGPAPWGAEQTASGPGPWEESPSFSGQLAASTSDPLSLLSKKGKRKFPWEEALEGR